MNEHVRVGYIPLVDAALLHVAKAKGFAAAAGIDLELVPEASWANIRDKLILGIFDAAHMLAPAAIATSLGLGHIEASLVAPVSLGLDGNAITLSNGLHDAVMAALDGEPSNPKGTAQALGRVVAQHRARGLAPLTFAHVFPFSSHHYQLRLWLRAGDIDPNRDVRLIVLPPPLMAQGLALGHVDAFCVGAPWGSVAMASGVGRILHASRDIVRDCPEKVLALRSEWALARPSATKAFATAIRDASLWASDAGNHEELAHILEVSGGLTVTSRLVAAFLDGSTDGPCERLRLDPSAIGLSPAQATWLYAHMVAAGQLLPGPRIADRARQIFRPDLGIDGAAAPLPQPFDGPAVLPDKPDDYLATLLAQDKGAAHRPA